MSCLRAVLRSAASSLGLPVPLVLDAVAFSGCYQIVAEVILPDAHEMMVLEPLLGAAAPHEQQEQNVHAFDQQAQQQHHEQQQQQLEQLQQDLLAAVPEGWSVASVQTGPTLALPAQWLPVDTAADLETPAQQQQGQDGAAWGAGMVLPGALQHLSAVYLEPPALVPAECKGDSREGFDGISAAASDTARSSNSSGSSSSLGLADGLLQQRVVKLCLPHALLLDLQQQGFTYIRAVVGVNGGEGLLADKRWTLTSVTQQQQWAGVKLQEPEHNHDHHQQQQVLEDAGHVKLDLELNVNAQGMVDGLMGWLTVAWMVGGSKVVQAQVSVSVSSRACWG